jgi:hypothetical protein
MEDAMTQERGDSYPKLREALGDEGFAELARLIRTTYEANEERRLRRDAEDGETSPGDAKRLDSIPGAWDRAQEGLGDVAAGRVVPLDEL